MLSMNDLKVGTIFTHDSKPHVVVSATHMKTGRGGANLRAKIKNLLTGQNLEITYSGSSKIEEADVERSKASFLYHDDNNYYFMDASSYEQFGLSSDTVSDQAGFLKEGQEVDVMLYNGRPVSIKLPAKVELKVTEAPPGIKGDTAGSAMKIAVLETGKEIKVPLFLTAGETIRINTETGEYVERVS